MRTTILVAALVAFVPACSKGKQGKGPATAAAALAAWEAAGLQPSEFAAAPGDRLSGGKCKAGTIDGVDTTLCEFPSEDAAKKAEPAGLALVGDVTGASIAQGRLLLVVADRRNADPNGRRINQITKTFRHLR